MSDFERLWQFVVDRSQRGVMTVQEKSELEHVYNLMKDCDCQSYLEVGTAEGNSLYVLGHLVKRFISYIDLGEKHTGPHREDVVGNLLRFYGNNGIETCINSEICDSTKPNRVIESRLQYDCILIDGGHDFATVLSDSILYAPLAKKYVFWHDIQLPQVKLAVEWFIKRWPLGKYTTFINSSSYGYAIMEIGV